MFVTCPKCSAKYQIPAEVHLQKGKKLKCSNCQYVFALTEDIVEKNNEIPNPPEVGLPVSETQEPVVVKDINPEPEHQVFAEEMPESEENVDVPSAFTPPETVDEPQLPETKEKKTHWLFLILCVVALGLLAALAWQHPEMLSLDGLLDRTQDAAIVNDKMEEPVLKQAENIPQIPEKKVVSEYVEETPEMVLLPEIRSVRFETRLEPEPTVRIEGMLKNTSNHPIKLPKTVRVMAYGTNGTVLFEKEIYLTEDILGVGEELNFWGSYGPATETVQWVDVTF